MWLAENRASGFAAWTHKEARSRVGMLEFQGLEDFTTSIALENTWIQCILFTDFQSGPKRMNRQVDHHLALPVVK